MTQHLIAPCGGGVSCRMCPVKRTKPNAKSQVWVEVVLTLEISGYLMHRMWVEMHCEPDRVSTLI
jgi:hypothetical protein